MLVNVREACQILGCCRQTLYANVDQVGGKKFGKTWKFNKERLEEYAGVCVKDDHMDSVVDCNHHHK